jgi:pilus assembly protein Flp/PilA
MFAYLVSIHSRLLTFKGDMAEKLRQEDGQGMVEYGLILFLVSVVAIAALQIIGVKVNEVFEKIGNDL